MGGATPRAMRAATRGPAGAGSAGSGIGGRPGRGEERPHTMRGATRRPAGSSIGGRPARRREGWPCTSGATRRPLGNAPGPRLGASTPAHSSARSLYVHRHQRCVTTRGHDPPSLLWDEAASRVAHRELSATDPVALRPHATTLHPHLGTTLWMDADGPVDESGAPGGKPVSTAGTAGGSGASSTGLRIRPRVRPRRSPHLDTASDQHQRSPSTLRTGPLTTAGVLSLNI